MKLTLFRPLDAVLFALIAAAGVAVVFSFKSSPGSRAEVYVNGRKAAGFTLSVPVKSTRITTDIGPVWIRCGGGAIEVIKSPCPQKICLKQGAIKHTHEQIICVPAKLFIRILGEAASSGTGDIDAVTK